MSNDKKSAKDVLPEDQKDKAKDMPDHLKSPLNELEDKRKTVKKATDKTK